MKVPLTAAWKDSPVLGCHSGDCHCPDHNLRARADTMNPILEDFGMKPECLRQQQVPVSEGPRFGQVVTEMVEQAGKLGPSPYRTQ